MAQFDVYPNPHAGQKHIIPFLLDVQSDLLGALNTTVVVPFYDPAAVSISPIRGLMPVFEVQGQSYVMVSTELAGVPRKRLPPGVANLGVHRSIIMAALDIILTGF
ncbi:CcdB family protein [Methylococcus sp. EFPC2]|uniref:CcdB family protein n=1 Tax=Methylococcus sp. EFPC2 TaxID=2812648 RepID=UPI0019670314|nr:CcdB family protein [Methylococcus sp. EFPC2]QSA97044.1 CcdB family protein [Methylococcus sp. EFPC2]